VSESTTTTTTTAAQLAQIREQVRAVLPNVQSDAALRRALMHAQTALEARLGQPTDTQRSRQRSRGVVG